MGRLVDVCVVKNEVSSLKTQFRYQCSIWILSQKGVLNKEGSQKASSQHSTSEETKENAVPPGKQEKISKVEGEGKGKVGRSGTFSRLF